MCFNHLSFRIPENNLLTAGVSAIRQEFLGDDGSSLAELLAMSLSAATFQAEGALPLHDNPVEEVKCGAEGRASLQDCVGNPVERQGS